MDYHTDVYGLDRAPSDKETQKQRKWERKMEKKGKYVDQKTGGTSMGDCTY